MTGYPSALSFFIKSIQNGRLSPFKLLEDTCQNLETIDKQIKSFLPERYRCDRVQNDLYHLFEKFPDEKKRPPLFAIPVGIKDLFNVDGLPTQAGSKIPPEEFKGKEAKIVSQLKEAGAIILGKTVTTEFAYFTPGKTVNPHNPLHTPGGSSSGSAAAVAAGICPLAFGTQTIGSISRPASYCGVIGFKPSQGRLSTEGIFLFAPSIDQAGYFTNDLQGAKIVASILCENWNKNIKTSKDPVIGIPKDNYIKQADRKITKYFKFLVSILKSSKFKLIRLPAFENIKKLNNQHNDIIAYEFAKVHTRLYKKYSHLYSDKSKELYQKGASIKEDYYKSLLKQRLEFIERFTEYTRQNGIDIWISPSATSLAPKGLSSTGSPLMNLPWTYLGFPTLSVPFQHPLRPIELPWNIQFATLKNEDEKLFNYVEKISEGINGSWVKVGFPNENQSV